MRTLHTLALCCALLGCQKADNSNPIVLGSGAGSGSSAGHKVTMPGVDKLGSAASNTPQQPVQPPPAPPQPPKPPPAPAKDIDSKEILARTATTPDVDVKHVLIGWGDLAEAYQGHMDPRAEKRSNDEAAALAQDVEKQLRKDPSQIDALMDKYSEDPGSVASHSSYTIDAASQMMPEFKNLAMRLKMKEVGIVKTSYGYHVMERVAPDPLQSNDILARAEDPNVTEVHVQHVLIGWKGVGRDPRAAKRTKAEADKIAKDTYDKLKHGADIEALMKDVSEDPGSKDTGRVYDVGAKTRMVEPFKKLSLRLKLGEVGIVKTQFGWHVIKRVPPDSLESADILARKPETDKAKVKHILLGWTVAHTDDERGKTRTRADLEKLVTETLAKVRKGDAIEPLMAELSEDPGSAKAGTTYDVTPDAGLVEPFKALSLRLKVGEAGAVKTDFGIHIIKRVE